MPGTRPSPERPRRAGERKLRCRSGARGGGASRSAPASRICAVSGPSAVAGRAVTTGFSPPGASAARKAKMHMKSWTVTATNETTPKTQKAIKAGLGIAARRVAAARRVEEANSP